MPTMTKFSESLLAAPRYDRGPFRLPPATMVLCQGARIGIVGLLIWRFLAEARFALDRDAVIASMWRFPGVSVYGVETYQLGILLFLNLALVVGLQAGIFLSLYQLFTGFVRGEVFTLRSGLQLRRAGLFALCFVVAGPLREMLATALLTMQLPDGPRWVYNWVNWNPLYDFVFGSVGFVLGQVFVAAVDIAEDNAQIL